MKYNPARSSLLLVLIGVVVLILGVILLVYHTVSQKDTVTCPAVVTEIKERHSGTDVEHTVYIEYTYDGIVYNTSLGYSSGSMYVGRELTININPADPTSPIAYGLDIGGWICFCCGMLFIAFGIWLHLRKKLNTQS